MNKDLISFFSSFGSELESKVKRLDAIIGRDHWLSVGNYKESLLRNFLRSVLPKKYEISTGFIVSKDRDGKLLKSKQIDIIIWDSMNFSAIFRDSEFVIIAPESCKAVIEVKGKLRLNEIKKTIDGFDILSNFLNIKNNYTDKIGRYLFAFDLQEKIEFPASVIKKIADTYKNSKIIPLVTRLEFEEKYSKCSFLFDGIYIINKGLVTAVPYTSNIEKHHFMFQSYEYEEDKKECLYSRFEAVLQEKLGGPNFWNENYGSLPIKKILEIEPTSPKSRLIIPKIKREVLHQSLDEETFFEESFEN